MIQVRRDSQERNVEALERYEKSKKDTQPFLNNINSILDNADERPDDEQDMPEDWDIVNKDVQDIPQPTGQQEAQSKKSFASKMLGRIEKRLDKVN